MALLQQDRFFQELFQRMAVPRFVVRPGRAGDYAIAEANDLALRYFGLPADKVAGQSLGAVVDYDNAQHFQQSFEVCQARRRSVTIQSLPGVPGPFRVYGFYITPVFDDDGVLQYLDVIGQIDVADQSILQRERDDAVSLMSSIFEVSEVGIVVTDHNGRIVKINESFVRLFGWPRNDLINTDFVGLVSPDEREKIRESHRNFDGMSPRNDGEMKILCKDGRVANTLYTTAVLELSQKRRYLITTVMDITLRKQMEESLRRAKDQADAASRAKSTFLANMSHELRTPMNAIIGFSEMIIKETFGPLGNHKYKEYLTDVHSSANHLLSIINEVLDMSKIEAGRIELDEGEIEIAPLVASVLRMMASRAFGNNITLKSEIAPGLPNLIGDQRLVRQILINLVTNAIKFSHPNQDVMVKAGLVPGGGLQLMVQDQGVGIPADKIAQAMEPFGQVSENSDNANSQGTGLGLPLAKAMVELHDGALSLVSDTGKGTSVFITFPKSRVLPRRG